MDVTPTAGGNRADTESINIVGVESTLIEDFTGGRRNGRFRDSWERSEQRPTTRELYDSKLRIVNLFVGLE